MSEYKCFICKQTKHTSKLTVIKLDGIETLVCEDCMIKNYEEAGEFAVRDEKD